MTDKNSMPQAESNTRWWESYLVRYAIGTIVGALCVYALLDAIGGNVMAKALMMPSVSSDKIVVLVNACKDANANACVAQLKLYQDLYGFNLPQLLLLGIYGLGYCYLASSPGLVVHAVRRQLMSREPSRRAENKYLALLFIAFILLPVVSRWLCGTAVASWAVLLAAIFMIVMQLRLLYLMWSEGDATLSFYVRLHWARQDPVISLDSYRHLREHGNAFFIVILELIFLAVAFSLIKLFGTNPYWPAPLVLWIVPGAAVYFLGHRIESLMVYRQ